MIINIILISGFVVLFLYAFIQYRRARSLSIVMMFVSLSGGLMSLFPENTTIIANWVGVGRGADLILYCFVVVMLLVIFNLHLRLRTTQETATEVARAVALINVRPPENECAPETDATDGAPPTGDDEERNSISSP